MIPSPKSKESWSKRSEVGLLPGETDVVRIVREIDANIAFFRSGAVSGLWRCDSDVFRDFDKLSVR